MSLYVCFVVQAHGPVGQELLWQVLARAGILAETIVAIRQFRDVMWARARMDDGKLSEWFPVT